MNFMVGLLFTLFIIICFLLIIVILLQKGRGGGLGAAFGGASSSAFGTRTGDVLTWVTIVLTALYLLLAVVTSLASRTPPGTIAAPQFNPPDGTAAPVKVAIEARTRGAKVYYTVDGSVPTEKSTAYDKPVDVKPGTTLKARAFRRSWPPSEVSEAYYPAAESQPATATQPELEKGGAPAAKASQPAGK